MASFVSDFKNSLTSAISLAPQAVRTGNANGTGVDCLLAEGSVGVHYDVGAVTGGPTSLTITVEESDVSGSGYAAITNQSTEGTVDVTAGSVSGYLNLWHRSKRYVRVVATLVGGTNYYLSASVVINKKISSTSSGSYTTIT